MLRKAFPFLLICILIDLRDDYERKVEAVLEMSTRVCLYVLSPVVHGRFFYGHPGRLRPEPHQEYGLAYDNTKPHEKR